MIWSSNFIHDVIEFVIFTWLFSSWYWHASRSECHQRIWYDATRIFGTSWTNLISCELSTSHQRIWFSTKCQQIRFTESYSRFAIINESDIMRVRDIEMSHVANVIHESDLMRNVHKSEMIRYVITESNITRVRDINMSHVANVVTNLIWCEMSTNLRWFAMSSTNLILRECHQQIWYDANWSFSCRADVSAALRSSRGVQPHGRVNTVFQKWGRHLEYYRGRFFPQMVYRQIDKNTWL